MIWNSTSKDLLCPGKEFDNLPGKRKEFHMTEFYVLCAIAVAMAGFSIHLLNGLGVKSKAEESQKIWEKESYI